MNDRKNGKRPDSFKGKRGSNRREQYNGKGRGKQARDARYDKRDDERKEMSPVNDISWYARNPELLAAAGAFPYPYRPGMSLDMGTYALPDNASTTNNRTLKLNIPGVLQLQWMPTIGRSTNATDPASVVAKEVYGKVRDAYSGSLDADAPDFITYLMGLDSIFGYIAWLKRLYRTLSAWTPQNYVVPDLVLKAMGFDGAQINNLRANKVQLWQYINELVLQSRKFVCPAIMDVFNRHYWMSDNIYTDAPSINSQFYLFDCKNWYKVGEVTLADGSGNKGVGLNITTLTVFGTTSGLADKLFTYGRDLIDAMAAWDDCYTINGYLKRAYEGAPTFVVDELAIDEVLSPVYVEEVLLQIENARCVPWFVDFKSNTVTQDPRTNAVVCKPVLQSAGPSNPRIKSSGIYRMNPIISVRTDTPQVADTVVATRLQAVCLDNTTSNTVDVYTGTEIPLQWSIYAPNFTGVFNQIYILRAGVTTDTDLMNFFPLMGIEQFDYHPFVWLAFNFDTAPSGGAANWDFLPLGDVHNITTSTREALINLHRVCLFSEFNAFQR